MSVLEQVQDSAEKERLAGAVHFLRQSLDKLGLQHCVVDETTATARLEGFRFTVEPWRYPDFRDVVMTIDGCDVEYYMHQTHYRAWGPQMLDEAIRQLKAYQAKSLPMRIVHRFLSGKGLNYSGYDAAE